jgi:putative addiction module component (TIGR02574 family)
MTISLNQIQEQARQLSLSDRATLARSILQELDGPAEEDVETAWIGDAKRRFEEYKSGKIGAIDGDEAMARIRKRLNDRL